jgi:hypothetical protein
MSNRTIYGELYGFVSFNFEMPVRLSKPKIYCLWRLCILHVNRIRVNNQKARLNKYLSVC